MRYEAAQLGLRAWGVSRALGMPMRIHSVGASIAMACLALAGCQPSAKAPTGQVAATVNGQEITQKQIDTELAGTQLGGDPHALEAARRQALQSIIARKLLAKAARDQGLDKTPEFAVREQGQTEAILAQALEAKLVNAVPQPTADDAQDFMRKYPDVFAERKIFTVDQIRFMPPPGSNVLRELHPLNTLEDVEAVLNREKIPFQRSLERLDAVGADPSVIAQIVKLPPNEVFIMPSRAGVSASQIKDEKVEPFVGDAATKYATQWVLMQRRRESFQRYLGQMIAKASANNAVVLSKLYQPPKPQSSKKAAS
jgi:peptidyl-prolyl cis-trans isomerase C